MSTRNGGISSVEAAVALLERNKENCESILGFTIPDEGNIDLDELEAEMERADDAFFGFLTPEWPGPHAEDLMRVEGIALYSSKQPPNKKELEDLWYYRHLIGLVKACVRGQIEDLEDLAKKKNIHRAKNKSGRAEADLIQFMESWDPHRVVMALRTVERRATYLHADPLEPGDAGALLLFREFLDRLSIYAMLLENGGSRDVRSRKERLSPTTSAN